MGTFSRLMATRLACGGVACEGVHIVSGDAMLATSYEIMT
jgi:hypothetical protein